MTQSFMTRHLHPHSQRLLSGRGFQIGHFLAHTMAGTSNVKSWIYTTAGYPATLTLSETTVPTTPSPHHLLVQVRASALNPVDIQLMNLSLNSSPGLNKPKIPGRDFAGVVLAAAPETQFQKGDEVMGISMSMDGTGFLTEVAHLDIRGACVVKKPSHLTWVQAASLPLVWLTARTAVEKCVAFMKDPIPANNKLVVLGGSSSTGIYMVKLAHDRGWTVLSTCSPRNIDFVRSLGANQVVDYTTSPDAVPKAVAAFKPHAILDCVGGTDCIGLAPQYVTIVGDKTNRATMGGSALYLTHPRMALRWLLGYLGLSNSYECIILQMKKEWLEEATNLQGERDIFIDSTFPFDRTKEAFERLDTGRTRGKVVVEVDG